MTDPELRKMIREFIVDNFLFGDRGELEDGTSLVGEGIVDSTGILELLSFLETTFQIKVKDEEVMPENLDSIDSILVFLESKGILAA
jgi:acyl carrier protein